MVTDHSTNKLHYTISQSRDLELLLDSGKVPRHTIPRPIKLVQIPLEMLADTSLVNHMYRNLHHICKDGQRVGVVSRSPRPTPRVSIASDC
jgi:hypothetical protein